MKKVLGIFLGLIAVMIIGVIGIGFFSGQPNSLFHNASESAKAIAANAAIEASGFKGKISQALQDNRENIALSTGMSLEAVDSAIDDLDIESWQACPLPSDAVSAGSYSGSYGDMDGTITTYTDPTYVTVDTAGQTITLAVPDTAQNYLHYLSYLG